MKTFCFIICLVLSSATLAGGSTAYGKITHMYVNTNWTMVMVTGISENPDECAHTDYYSINPVDKNYNALHSTLMAAHMSGKSVRFYVSGCSGQSGDYPHIISVWVN